MAQIPKSRVTTLGRLRNESDAAKEMARSSGEHHPVSRYVCPQEGSLGLREEASSGYNDIAGPALRHPICFMVNTANTGEIFK